MIEKAKSELGGDMTTLKFGGMSCYWHMHTTYYTVGRALKRCQQSSDFPLHSGNSGRLVHSKRLLGI